MGEGQTFLSEFKTTKSGDKRHLMIVVAEKNGEYLIIPVTTWYEDLPPFIQDNSCILNEGDHPFIKHKSWLNFKFAQAKQSIEILQGLLNGLLIRKEDLSPELLAYIQSKTKDSKRLPSKLRYFFED